MNGSGGYVPAAEAACGDFYEEPRVVSSPVKKESRFGRPGGTFVPFEDWDSGQKHIPTPCEDKGD
ncbi:MAG TPA: hypothetical protein PKA63_07430 [Oligoflexia bacterium]|nr:hypothetical protein [Oligoflexia bacterium]HMP48481.1 hypothetical protein [Oligoflexia bacterium]